MQLIVRQLVPFGTYINYRKSAHSPQGPLTVHSPDPQLPANQAQQILGTGVLGDAVPKD